MGFIRILMFACAAVGFIYGVICFFKKKTALFNQLIVCAVGCMMLSRLYDLVIIMVSGQISSKFNLGDLGLAGCFLFLFSASYGQMDSLVDGGEKSMKKYRLIALIAPFAIIAIFAVLCFWADSIRTIILNGIIFAIIALCSYFNMKQLIIPDVEYGILKSIRAYNFIALVFCLVCALQFFGEKTKIDLFRIIISIISCTCYLAIIPVLKWGSKKWLI